MYVVVVRSGTLWPCGSGILLEVVLCGLLEALYMCVVRSGTI